MEWLIWLTAHGRRVCRESIRGPRTNGSHSDQNKRTGADEKT